jgi:hypothetical protein
MQGGARWGEGGVSQGQYKPPRFRVILVQAQVFTCSLGGLIQTQVFRLEVNLKIFNSLKRKDSCLNEPT